MTKRRRSWTVAAGLIIAIGAAGCGSDDPAATFSSDQPGLDGPVVRYRERSVDGGEDAEIGGVIEIEGDCLYLAPVAGGGERYPVVWPYSSEWDAETPGVRLGSGTVLAVGDRVDTAGGYHGVEAVLALAGQDAVDLVADCLDNTYGEIAVINNLESLVWPD
ncbi:MAG: hypothetical protein AAF467_14630 [Actinomycetota bacterium]